MQKLAWIPRRGPAIAACVALLLAGAAQADGIYKWVDKDGRTHYSSRREDAQGAATTTMRPAPPPAAGGPPPAAAAANEEIIRRGTTPIDGRYVPPVAVQKPGVRNYASEAPADKCQLARDILSGRARHTNGAAISAHDREIAESDVRAFCGK